MIRITAVTSFEINPRGNNNFRNKYITTFSCKIVIWIFPFEKRLRLLTMCGFEIYKKLSLRWNHEVNMWVFFLAQFTKYILKASWWEYKGFY